MKFLAILALAVITPAIASDFTLIEPGSTYRGNARSLSTDFPYTNIQQFYAQNERPVHYAFVTKPFFMGLTEVTVGEFKKFVDATGYQTEAEKSGKGIVGWNPSELAEGESGRGDRHDFIQDHKFNWKNPGFEQGENHPVVGVSWNDANAYCKWLSKETGATYRLPTEAEWELACRGDSRRKHFYWGDEAKGVIQKYANIGNSELEKVRKLAAIRHWAFDPATEPGDGHVFTAPVASFQPNLYGLYDMSGNVLEWCQDYFKFTYYDHWMPKSGPNPVAVDPVNLDEKESDFNERRTIRGGSWYLGPLSARTSARNFFDAEAAAAYIGFRVVMEAPQDVVAKYSDPHTAYQKNIQTLTGIGARFSPINRRAQIHLSNEPLTLELAKAITAIPGLHIISNAKAEPWNQEIWDEFSNADALDRFSVRGSGLETVNMKRFALNQREITSLDISAQGFSDAHLQQLAPLSSLTTAQFTFQPGAVTDAGLRHLANNPKLSTLRFYYAEITGEFIDAFKSPSLLTLNVSGRNDSPGWSKLGSENLVRYAPRLIELFLTNQSFQDEDLEPLAGLSRLSSFFLNSCPNLTDEGIAKLLAKLGRIQRFHATDSAAGPAVAQGVPKMYFLKDLRIEGDPLSDGNIQQISRSRSLSSLYLDSAGAPSYSAKALSSLWRIPNLERLHIAAPLPLDNSFKDFIAAPAIKELTLNAGCLTDEFVGMLTRLGTLERLNIQRAADAVYAEWEAKIKKVRPRLKVQKR